MIVIRTLTWQLVCTVRLDLRLSALLNVYYDAWHAKDADEVAITRRFEGLFDILPMVPPSAEELEKAMQAMRPGGLKEGFGGPRGRRKSSRGHEHLIQAAIAGKNAAMGRRGSKAAILRSGLVGLSHEPVKYDLVTILLDLTYYNHKELASSAVGLMVRHFEQRKLLDERGRQVQLLVKEVDVRMHGTFTPLLLQLNRLTQRRRLYGVCLPSGRATVDSFCDCHCADRAYDPAAVAHALPTTIPLPAASTAVVHSPCALPPPHSLCLLQATSSTMRHG